MTTPTKKLFPSVPLEKDDLKQRLERKLNDVNSFTNSLNNIRERILFFQRQKTKMRKKF